MEKHKLKKKKLKEKTVDMDSNVISQENLNEAQVKIRKKTDDVKYALRRKKEELLSSNLEDKSREMDNETSEDKADQFSSVHVEKKPLKSKKGKLLTLASETSAKKVKNEVAVNEVKKNLNKKKKKVLASELENTAKEVDANEIKKNLKRKKKQLASGSEMIEKQAKTEAGEDENKKSHKRKEKLSASKIAKRSPERKKKQLASGSEGTGKEVKTEAGEDENKKSYNRKRKLSASKIAKTTDETETDLHGVKKTLSKKKKNQHASSGLDNGFLDKSEADADGVDEICLVDEDCSAGMKKWLNEYWNGRPGLKILQQKIDEFIIAHEAQEEQARKEREALAAEGGWTVVVHQKGRKKTTDSETGVTMGSVAQAAVMDNIAKKKNKEVPLDFYRFQRREARRNEVMMLQSKFEQDKKRIQQLRAARKFRPY